MYIHMANEFQMTSTSLFRLKIWGELDQILTDFGFVQGAWRDGRIVPFSRREIVYRRMTRGKRHPI